MVAEGNTGVRKGVVVVIGGAAGISGEVNPNLGKPGGGQKLEVPVNSEWAAGGAIVAAGRVLLETLIEGKKD